MITRLLAIMIVAFLAGTVYADNEVSGISPVSDDDLMLADNRRKERRDDRGDDRDDKQECRQEEGLVGDDKRECKQENRGEDDEEEKEEQADAQSARVEIVTLVVGAD